MYKRQEQTKNEPKNENKAAPDNGKPKKERKPLTEAQRLKRQKMIVLPDVYKRQDIA